MIYGPIHTELEFRIYRERLNSPNSRPKEQTFF